jgi:flagellar assembly protein FliH
MTSDPKKQPKDATGQNYTSWSLPEISSSVVLSSAEKEARERKDQRFKKPKKTGPVDEAAGESIEIVETIEKTYKPITAEQLQAITDAAEKEGYDAGYAKGIEAGEIEGDKRGYTTGLDKADKKVVERCERIERVIEALLIPLDAERKKLEILIVDMICQLTEAVVLREIELDSSQVIKLVDDALNAIPTGSEKFSLFLNEQDIALVESHLNDHQSDKKFNYYVDENLLPGGCRLETKNSTVSNTVEQRLKKVIDDFMHKRIVATDEEIEDVKKVLDDSSANTTIEEAAENLSSNNEPDSELNSQDRSEPHSELKSEVSSAADSDSDSTDSSSSASENLNKDLNEELSATSTSTSASTSTSDSNTSPTNENNVTETSSANSPSNVNDDKVINKDALEQEQKKKTESMSPLESEKQKRDSQKPQQASLNANKIIDKASHEEGENDAPV